MAFYIKKPHIFRYLKLNIDHYIHSKKHRLKETKKNDEGFAYMMTSSRPMSSMIKSKQKVILLITMMLLAQAVVLIPSATANISTDSTLRTTFSNDDNFVIIQFDSFGNQIQPGASLEIPRNSTVEALNL